MNRRARISSFLMLVLAGGGFMWMAVSNLGLRSGQLALELVVVVGMIVLLIVLALLAGIGLRALLNRAENRHDETDDDE